MNNWMKSRIEKLDRECSKILAELAQGIHTMEAKRQSRLYAKYTQKLTVLAEYRGSL